ncbi:MAG: hypothetical protein IT203_04035 [Fimbriimonadaceae bacterium]|nr:hypothetical protein [Fimbriimonadaceae bacterium]
MTLHVDFDQFAATVKRLIAEPLVFVARRDHRTCITASDPAKQMLIFSQTKLSIEDAEGVLQKDGMEVRHGYWTEGEPCDPREDGHHVHVAAVSYRSGEDMPGIWVDAYSDLPSTAMVLKALFDEFKETGEVGDLPFEEFVRIANPNVVIVSPVELERFLESKENNCP